MAQNCLISCFFAINLSFKTQLCLLHNLVLIFITYSSLKNLTYFISVSGEQNSLISVIKHTFTRRAFNVTCGPFGSSKSRDLICIQALDGTLSFFDQDTFLFMCIFDDIIIPGPICYVANSDQFVVCKSTWVMEIYRYKNFKETHFINYKTSYILFYV